MVTSLSSASHFCMTTTAQREDNPRSNNFPTLDFTSDQNNQFIKSMWHSSLLNPNIKCFDSFNKRFFCLCDGSTLHKSSLYSHHKSGTPTCNKTHFVQIYILISPHLHSFALVFSLICNNNSDNQCINCIVWIIVW